MDEKKPLTNRVLEILELKNKVEQHEARIAELEQEQAEFVADIDAMLARIVALENRNKII